MTTILKKKVPDHLSSFKYEEDHQKTDSIKTRAVDDLSSFTVSTNNKKPLLSSTSLWALDLASDRIYELVGSELLPSALLQWKNVINDVANRGELLPSARLQWKKVTRDVVAKRGELLPSARLQWKKVTRDVAKRGETGAVVKMKGPDPKWNSTSDRPTDEVTAKGMEENVAEGMEENAAEGMEENAAEGMEHNDQRE